MLSNKFSSSSSSSSSSISTELLAPLFLGYSYWQSLLVWGSKNIVKSIGNAINHIVFYFILFLQR
jgi:hypothetical protein